MASLALLALSACAGDESPDPGPDAVDLRVRQIYGMSQGGYFEGSYSYVRVENLDGDELIEKRFTQDPGKLDELRFLFMTASLRPRTMGASLSALNRRVGRGNPTVALAEASELDFGPAVVPGWSPGSGRS